MRVAVETEPMFLAGNPGTLFESGAYYMSQFTRSFDISRDGERVLMIKADAGSGADDPYVGMTRVIVVQNWLEELKRLVPVDN